MGDLRKEAQSERKLPGNKRRPAWYRSRIVVDIIADAFLFARFLIGPRSSCRFYPSCTLFALDAIERHSPMQALVSIVKRLLSCHPLFMR